MRRRSRRQAARTPRVFTPCHDSVDAFTIGHLCLTRKQERVRGIASHSVLHRVEYRVLASRGLLRGEALSSVHSGRPHDLHRYEEYSQWSSRKISSTSSKASPAGRLTSR